MANRTFKLLARTKGINLYVINECGTLIETKMNLFPKQEISYDALVSLLKHKEMHSIIPRSTQLGPIIGDWLASKR